MRVGQRRDALPTLSGRQHVVVAAACGAGYRQARTDPPGARHRGGQCQAAGAVT